MRTVVLTSSPVNERRLPQVQLGRAQASTASIDSPPPGSGEILRTALPDTFDGIRYEIGRMKKYVLAAAHDPWLQDFAARICSDYAGMADEFAQLQGRSLSDVDREVATCEALDLWCRDHFAYVNDPPNIEVIQTPRRMVKQTLVPPEVIREILDPFYEEFSKVPSFYVDGYVPPPLYFGDCDEAVVCFLGLCLALRQRFSPTMNGAGREALRGFFRFGGNDGTLHHVWAKVKVSGNDIDADHTEPGYKMGDFSRFEAYEEVEVAA